LNINKNNFYMLFIVWNLWDLRRQT
jgi:hypothetical protein